MVYVNIAKIRIKILKPILCTDSDPLRILPLQTQSVELGCRSVLGSQISNHGSESRSSLAPPVSNTSSSNSFCSITNLRFRRPPEYYVKRPGE